MPEVVRDALIYGGRRVSLIKRFVRINEDVVVREVVRFGEAAAALPILNDGRAVLIKQFRAPVKGWVLEIPAGVVEPGETPEETIRRELIEEVGYEAGSIEELVTIHTSPGYSDEVLHIFLARNLRFVGSRPERYEVIEPVIIDPEEALRRLMTSKVADSKTLIALLIYLSEKPRLGHRTST